MRSNLFRKSWELRDGIVVVVGLESNQLPYVTDCMRLRTNTNGPSPRSERFSVFFPPRSVNSVDLMGVAFVGALSSGACPFASSVAFAWSAESSVPAALSGGSKVSLRKADLRFFACGSLMDSSDP